MKNLEKADWFREETKTGLCRSLKSEGGVPFDARLGERGKKEDGKKGRYCLGDYLWRILSP